MTVLSRGSRSRRGGRRPGWTLVTALLVLAVAASSALVFTNRTELLKLAVILALWAAVVAAFISVIYRRQSDIDQAKARDLKLVYDLQLDREIAARREYELEVETQLRRELSAEMSAEAADEVAALRAELAALRSNLEILFETDLAHRPALETERSTARVYSDWDRDSEQTDPGRVPRSRFTASAREDVDVGPREDEDHIIDVHEEPPEPEEPLSRRSSGLYVPPSYGGGAHRLSSDERPWAAQPPPEPQPEPMFRPEPTRPEPPEPRAQPYFSLHPQSEPEPTAASGWASGNGYSPEPPREPPSVTDEPRRGRHASEAEPGAPTPPPPAPAAAQVGRPDYGVAAPARPARHSADAPGYAQPPSTPTFPTPPPPEPTPAPRHGSEAPQAGEAQHGEGQGQSVAELLARLQHGPPSEGGRRRRRED